MRSPLILLRTILPLALSLVWLGSPTPTLAQAPTGGTMVLEEPAQVVSNLLEQPIEITAEPQRERQPSVREQVREAIRTASQQGSRNRRQPVVMFGQSVVIRSNETAEVVVVFGGNATVDGVVRNAVVCFGGNTIINGKVGDAVVTFGGNSTINGDVGDAVVCFGGNINLKSKARVGGDVVAFGNVLNSEDGAIVGGQSESSPFPLPSLVWLQDWLRECLMKGRPLAPTIGWLWMYTGAMFLIYLLTLAMLARPVAACVHRLEQQPVSTFFVGLMTKVLVPLVIGLLIITGIGILALPFVFIALWFAQLVGKVALCQYLGQQLGRQFKSTALERPLLGFVLGWVIITALYLIPYLGFLALGTVSLWSLGAATVAAFGGSRREPPARSIAAGGTGASAPQPNAAGASAAGPGPLPPFMAPAAGSAALPPLVVPDALALPRAGFWPRIGAAFLDMVIVGILSSFIHWWGLPSFPIAAFAYFAGMIAWRGTTAGGVVLNLKVVRLDGGPLTFPVALVRALAAWLSVVVLFLGFFWIAWDPEKQSWHDKIAGTVVVRLSKAQPLICL